MPAIAAKILPQIGVTLPSTAASPGAVHLFWHKLRGSCDPGYVSAGHMGDPRKTIRKKLSTLTTDDGELVSSIEGDEGAFRLIDRNVIVRRIE